MSALICDGCGRAASAEHIAARIARLEWATRFRPIHIQALFVAESPSAQREEDHAVLLDALNISGPTGAAAVTEMAGTETMDATAGKETVARLIEFQRRGFYLAFLVECPLDAPGLIVGNGQGNGQQELRSGSTELSRRFTPTLVKRIQFSYRPKQIVPLATATRNIIPALREAGLGDALVLHDGEPFELPQPGDANARELQAAWQGIKFAGAVAK